jgi:Zn-dependent protease with chaperone function
MANRARSLMICCAVAAFVDSAAAAQTPLGSGDSLAPDRSASAGPAVSSDLEPVPVPEPSEIALRFYRSGNWLWVANQLWGVFLPLALAYSGASAGLRDLARRLATALDPRSRISRAVPLMARIAARRRLAPEPHAHAQPPSDTSRDRLVEPAASGFVWFLTIGIYVILYLSIAFLLNLPLAYYQGFIRLHAYGLSNQSMTKWLGNAVIRLAVAMGVGFALTWVPYLLMARSPRRWWLYTGILSVPFLFATMLVQPIWIDPLFNRFGPMKNKTLEGSILALARRAGIEGSRVFEVDKSVDTKAVNAYVTGVLGTKRIVLWDTLIAKLDEPELLCVMGHEMGHYVLGHVVRSILLGSLVVIAGLFLVDRWGTWLIARIPGRLGFNTLSDIASVPIVLMLIEIAFLVLAPVALAYSRYQEHEADRFALDLTRSNRAAALSFVKMQSENLSIPRPGLLYEIFRSSHPSTGERIEFCNNYHPWLSSHDPAQRDPNSTPPRQPGR